MPRWMMLGEVICLVEYTFGPYEVELFLTDSVFHPIELHVEGFGEFLSHVGSEYAVGG